MDGLRDHGYGDVDYAGTPEVIMEVKDSPGCPNCGCQQIYMIRVPVMDNRLKGATGDGTYMGCPACPWASPMVAIARKTSNEAGENN